MVKSTSSLRQKEDQPSTSGGTAAAAAAQQRICETPSSSSCKYTGVRKRKWGKYVSEIRLPNSRERIWLGSYDTAEKAARAFDAALFCLRGRNAKFNFPHDPPEIVNGRSMAPAEIQIAAARFAHEVPAAVGPDGSGRVEYLDSRSDTFTSHAGSPCPSVVSDGAANQVDSEMTGIPLDNALLDQFLTMGTEGSNISDFGLFPGFDDFSGGFLMPEVDYWPENNDEELLFSEAASLWNF